MAAEGGRCERRLTRRGESCGTAQNTQCESHQELLILAVIARFGILPPHFLEPSEPGVSVARTVRSSFR
jgi:hypothetical protein